MPTPEVLDAAAYTDGMNTTLAQTRRNNPARDEAQSIHREAFWLKAAVILVLLQSSAQRGFLEIVYESLTGGPLVPPFVMDIISFAALVAVIFVFWPFIDRHHDNRIAALDTAHSRDDQ